MQYNKVVIKQIPESNPTAINMDKYGRSRFPDCFDSFEPYQFPDGRYLTGLDPNGVDVLTIQDLDIRKQKQEEIQAIVTELTAIMGGKVDLSSTSSFWESPQVKVKIDSNNSLVLNKANPMDVVKYHYLVACGYVAPSKEAIGNPKFLNSNYYCHIDEVEMTKNISSRKLIDQAKSELFKISDNKDILYLIGCYLEGTRYKKTMKADSLYSMLSDYIEDKKSSENVEKFIKSTKLSIEDLQYKITIETAIRKKIIKYKEGHYYKGVMNLGRNIIEVMTNLKSPEYANEFMQIHEEVNSKF